VNRQMRDFSERSRVGNRLRRFRLAMPRPCKECGRSFQPRFQDVNNGRGFYCSKPCARIGTGKEARLSLEEDITQFWSHIDRTGGEDACWDWQGIRDDRGYGAAYFQRRRGRAHRLAYELARGPLSKDLCVCHHCDRPPCCNPAHLFAGSIADNNTDMVRKKRHARGERNGAAKLSAQSVHAIRTDSRQAKDIAGEHGISRALVSMIKQRKVWRHLHD
jgi:hypothetical protein